VNPSAIPTFIHQLELRSRRHLAGFAGGSQRSLFRGQGLEFAELRSYQEGDNLRHLDPAASARTGRLQVRTFQEERNQTILLLADLSRSTTPAKKQLLVEATALLGFAAALQRDRVGLLGFTDRIEFFNRPYPGLQHTRQLLHQLLTCVPQGTGTDLGVPLTTAEGYLQKPALVILLSDGHAEFPERQLRRLTARHELLCFVLRDPTEQNFSGRGLLQLRDAETDRTLTLDLTNRSTSRTAWQQLDTQLAGRLGKLGIEHLILQAGSSPAPRILNFFRLQRGLA